jgi:hypothetical protein
MVKRFIFWGLILLLWCATIPAVQAVEQTFYFTSLQYGSIDTERNAPPFAIDSDYLGAMEDKYGVASYDPKVEPTVISFEYYRVDGYVGIGFSIDLLSGIAQNDPPSGVFLLPNYNQEYQFSGGSRVTTETIGLLYGLSFYGRFQWFYPFFGVGTGNYLAKVEERLVNSGGSDSYSVVFGEVLEPYYYKWGVRFPSGEYGIMLSQYYIHAPLTVESRNKTLELGGVGTFFGFYMGF